MYVYMTVCICVHVHMCLCVSTFVSKCGRHMCVCLCLSVWHCYCAHVEVKEQLSNLILSFHCGFWGLNSVHHASVVSAFTQ